MGVRQVDRLAAVIELLAMCHPSGIRILQGQAPALSADAWSALIEAVRPSVDSPQGQLPGNVIENRALSEIRRGELIVEIIDRAGGWDMVVAAVRAFRLRHGDVWRSFVRYCQIKTAPCRFDTVTSLADSLHVDRSTLPRLSRRVSGYVAHMVVSGMVQQVFEVR